MARHLSNAVTTKWTLIWLLLRTQDAVAGSSIAYWYGHRGAIVQDVVVLEGGTMQNGTFANNKYSGGSLQNFPYGLYYNISLCDSFDISTIDSYDLLKGPIQETLDTSTPVYSGGGMFTNDHQFYTYGGQVYTPPRKNDSNVNMFNLYPPATNAPNFEPGVIPDIALPSDISDHITNGAYASSNSPSQYLSWYFGGMVSASGGEIAITALDDDPNHVSTASPTFLEIDTTKPNNATFKNLTLPMGLTPRAEGGLVWLPYNTEGVLIAFGGSQYPGDLFMTTPSAVTADDKNNNFMTEIAVYDIASKVWYIQLTNEEVSPTPLASFCTVVAETVDGSSHSIYVYGGYDGTYASSNKDVRDDVWVLSIPSFQWTRVSEGNPSHRRKGHVCVSPNPTTMLTIGGAVEFDTVLESDTSIDVFDLNLLEWTGRYNATSDAQYQLPDVITKQLGLGDSNGLGTGFTMSGLNTSLNTIFSTKYPHLTRTYKPFTCGKNETSHGSSHDDDPTPKPSSKVPLIAGICGGVGALIIAAIIFYCCRKNRKNKQDIERTNLRHNKVTSWFGRTTHTDPPPDESKSSGDTMVESGLDYFGPQAYKTVRHKVYEAPDSNVTSPGIPFTHGSPNMMSPHSPLSASVEVDAQSRHEIMDQPHRESMSIRNHPMYPRSIAGEYIMSQRSESISHPSENLMPSRNHGFVSPYELPQDRSNENLSQPPEDNVLGEPRAHSQPKTPVRSFGIDASQVESPNMYVPTAKIARKPVNTEGNILTTNQSPMQTDRPGHHRHTSSMSSNIPNLPSPNPDDDKRMSRHIDALPEPPYRKPSGPIRSAYQENFDELNTHPMNNWRS